MAEKLASTIVACFTRPSSGPNGMTATGQWTVSTDRGDKMRARYVVLANGSLTTPKLARIEGMETFAGKAFHTSRWDYNVDLAGQRVGIIGTGASRRAGHPGNRQGVKKLYVFSERLHHRRSRSTRDDSRGDRYPGRKNELGAGAGVRDLPGFHPDAPR